MSKAFTPLWMDKAVYQIYPRSFCDSNGDGIGDIPGIISKLDYLQKLGVGILWLSPIYKSPQFDMGYDISDYYEINPEYGTMEDFDRLVKEADKRGMKIVMDLVANHTSDEHAWFKASIDPNSPYRDYYVWKKGKNNDDQVPPNNWTSNFSGPAWTYVKEADAWYLHIFSAKQPDLNWHNPKVLEEVEGIMRFYLGKGVYGFRCDVINQIYKDSYEDSESHSPVAAGNEHYLNTEGNHAILRRIYDDVLSKQKDFMMLGETYAVDLENGRRYQRNHELTMFFQFDLVNVTNRSLPILSKPFDPVLFRDTAFKWQKGVDWPTNYLENHDQRRSITKFGDAKKHWKESGKALALMNLTLRGTPFIYEGEEIGMLDHPSLNPDESMDCSVIATNGLMKSMHIPGFLRRKFCSNFNRDHARTPMQWDGSVSAGFSSSAKTWLPVNPNYVRINVEEEEKDPSSILAYYRELLAYRNQSEALRHGDFSAIPVSNSLMAYERSCGEHRVVVILNFAKRAVRMDPSLTGLRGKRLFSTYDTKGKEGVLRPYEGILIEIS